MISRIHIQTVDACNANCVMCPYKSFNHSEQTIDSVFFERIIDDIAENIKKGRIQKDLELYLFLNNEPLLDDGLFDRIKITKRALPNAKIILFTNAILIHKFEKQLLNADIELLYVSMYGYDKKSFKKVTGVSLTDEEFKNINNSIDRIKKEKRVEVSNSWTVNSDNKPVLQDYSSRAGYYTSKILHKEISGCKHGRNKGWLNILDTGEIVLCCMDWRKEVVLGNLKHQNIEDVLKSENYKNIIDKTEGKVKTPDDFICKRCEWALPKKEEVIPVKKNKKLIIIATSDNKIDYLYDFLISLKVVGNYDGEIAVLGYSLSVVNLYFLEYFGARVIDCSASQNYQIVNTRLLDAYNFLKESNYQGYNIALFDVDMWFNKNINELFYEIDNVEGCYYGTEYRPGFFTFGKGRGPKDAQTEKENLDKMTAFVSKYQGHINAGFMGANYNSFLSKLKTYSQKTVSGYNIEVWGIDQYLYNLLFDFSKDNADGKKWNAVLNDIVLADNRYLLKDYSRSNERAIGISSQEANIVHCYGVFSEQDQVPYRFSYLNHKIFKNEFLKIIDSRLKKIAPKF